MGSLCNAKKNSCWFTNMFMIFLKLVFALGQYIRRFISHLEKIYIYIDFHLANETSFTYLEELLVVLDN